MQSGTAAPTDTRDRHEQVDPFLESTERASQSEISLSLEVRLDPGQFAHRELRIDEASVIRILGESTARMDVYLFAGEAAFAKFQAGEDPISSGPITATGIEQLDRSVEVPAGRYFLVFDNTPIFGAKPAQDVRSKFEVSISPDRPTPTKSSTAESSPSPTAESPDQPKIRAVEDNFGHRFTTGADHTVQFDVDDEIVVDDDTAVELCVTDIAKNADEPVSFDYWFGHTRSEHPDSPDGWSDSSCWQWDMGRDYYTSSWTFQIWIRNQDEIYYQNRSRESDFRVVVHYTNLSLANE